MPKRILLLITFVTIVFVSVYATGNTVTRSDTISIITSVSTPRVTASDTVSISESPSVATHVPHLVTTSDTVSISESPSVAVHTLHLVTSSDTVSITSLASMPVTTVPSTVSITSLASMPVTTVSSAVPVSTSVTIGMTIPSSHQNPILDYSSLLTGSGTVTIQNELDVDVNTQSGHAQVNFPAGTTISGPSSWNGIIDLPTVKPTNSVSFLIQPTIFHIVKKVFEIGANDILLTTDRAVHLAFVGDAGNQVGYSHGDPVHEITTGCTDDTQTTNDGLPVAGDCNIQVAGDLVAWTRHFSSFVVFFTTHGGDYTPGFPPSFTTGFAQNEYPLVINNNTYGLLNHVNTGPLSTIPIGSPFVINVMLYGDNGPSSVKHVSFFTNMRGNYTTISGADTAISWDATQPLQIADPRHFFGTITANTTVVDNKLLLTLHGAFANPMPVSDIGIRTWGYDLYSQDVYAINAWQATSVTTESNTGTLQNPQIPNASSIVPKMNTLNTTINAGTGTASNTANDLIMAVKEWSGYNPTAISDSQLLQSMGYQSGHIPSWVMKKVARYLVDGTITQDDFTNIIKYLVENHVVK